MFQTSLMGSASHSTKSDLFAYREFQDSNSIIYFLWYLFFTLHPSMGFQDFSNFYFIHSSIQIKRFLYLIVFQTNLQLSRQSSLVSVICLQNRQKTWRASVRQHNLLTNIFAPYLVFRSRQITYISNFVKFADCCAYS